MGGGSCCSPGRVRRIKQHDWYPNPYGTDGRDRDAHIRASQHADRKRAHPLRTSYAYTHVDPSADADADPHTNANANAE